MINQDIYKITVDKFATSDIMQQYIASFEGRHFEINEAVARLIIVMQKSETLSEVAEQYRGTNDRQYSESELEKIIEKYIIPIIDAFKRPEKHPFFFKFELLSKSTIEKFSNILKIVFHKYAITVLLSCIIVIETLFFINSTQLISLSGMNVYIISGVILLMLASSFMHELGHASACRYFKVEHGGVGFGLYMTFPVFYTDVSETWKLKRKERIIVNMAGIYFQLIMLMPFFLIYFLTGNNILKWFLLTVNVNLFVTLNPFFKFDGYWIMSDLLGVPNLRKRSTELISYFLKKMFHRKVDNSLYLFRIKNKEKFALIIYAIVVNMFFGFYILFFMPAFIYQFFTSFPGLIEQLIYTLSSGQTVSFSLIQQIFIKLLFFILIIYFLFRLIKPVLIKFKTNIKNAKQ
jgi:putative peptide zinc metalloprotease protein